VTIIPFAAAVCIDCRAPVAIVRRTVEVPCRGCDACVSPCDCGNVHAHAIPDVGPPTLVDEDGIRHECAMRRAIQADRMGMPAYGDAILDSTHAPR
jgi:hypothetical protein